MQFDYFYPEESENYVFYRTPKVLCTDKRFRGLSSDAKLLYGILLDRIQLSKKNRWIDEEGHVYVYMTIESIEQALGRCHQKSCKVLKELVNFGLAQGKGAGYERWAKVFNVKQVAKALLFLEEHDIRDLDSLNQRAKEATDHFNELSNTIKSAEKRMAEISVLKTHILNYAKTKEVYVAYRKAGYSKAFFEVHREEITLHKAAKQAFSELGVEKLPTVKQLNEEYAELLARKKEAYREYRKAKQEMTDFATAKYDIERFLNLEKEEETRAREKAKTKEETL